MPKPQTQEQIAKAQAPQKEAIKAAGLSLPEPPDAITVTLTGTTIPVLAGPRGYHGAETFSSGSRGYHGQGKVRIAGREFSVNIQIIEVGSKPKAK